MFGQNSSTALPVGKPSKVSFTAAADADAEQDEAQAQIANAKRKATATGTDTTTSSGTEEVKKKKSRPNKKAVHRSSYNEEEADTVQAMNDWSEDDN